MMADQIGIVTVVMSLVILMFQQPSASALPNQCPCVINVTTATADCNYKYDIGELKEIPNCVPNTTKELKFYGNDLTNKLGQFERFLFLTYLDLSNNLKFAPGCHSFDNLTGLKLLNLSLTNLEKLEPCVFSKLYNLETLRLHESGMRYLSVDLFRNLNSLNLLDLSSNKFSEISNNTFASLQNLTLLDLYDNLLVLNSHSFFGLSKLEFLLLDFCRVPNITSIPVTIFRPLTQLIEISLGGMCSFHRYNCKVIDQRLGLISSLEILTMDNFVINLLGTGFASLSHLQKIHFMDFTNLFQSSCNVTTLSNKTFQSLTNSPISKITLQWCKINKIMPFTFSMFKNLTYVELSNVTLGQVSKGQDMEIGLQESPIKHLHLSLYDPSVCISLSILKGLVSSKLQILAIDSSHVYEVQIPFFQSLPVSLKHLHLKNNLITAVQFCDLLRLKNLKVLDLSHQDYQYLQQGGIFYGLQNNETETDTDSTSNLSKASSISNSTDCSMCQKLPFSLSKIDINHSQLLCDLSRILCDSSNLLKYLDVSYQSKTHCFEIFWKVTKNLLLLEHLNAAESGLKIIPNYAFSQLSHLKNLTLHHNYLAIAEFDLQTPVLEFLDLSYNNILYLSNKLTDQLDSIAKHSNLVIYLEGNQLICDCERLYFVAWLRYNSAIHQKDLPLRAGFLSLIQHTVSAKLLNYITNLKWSVLQKTC